MGVSVLPVPYPVACWLARTLRRVAMITLVEDPMPIIFFGIVAEAILAAVLLRTGRGIALVAMIGVALLVLLGLGVERLVVTEREEVEAAIDGIAAALEANDLDRVLSFVDPAAGHTRGRAAWAMERAEVLDTKVRNLSINVNHFTSPPTARAEFNGVIRLRDRRGQFPYDNYAAKFTVEFRREGERWLITDHVEGKPLGQ